jgi:iron-sulfur cluster assembly protein
MTDMQSSTGAATESTVSVTPAAIKEIKRLIGGQPDPETAMLRVGVKGGGCSGLTYHMSFDRAAGEFDRTFTCDGITIVVDMKSLVYMAGTTIDFSSEILNGGFKFQNPKATRGCGCGTSFSV